MGHEVAVRNTSQVMESQGAVGWPVAAGIRGPIGQCLPAYARRGAMRRCKESWDGAFGAHSQRHAQATAFLSCARQERRIEKLPERRLRGPGPVVKEPNPHFRTPSRSDSGPLVTPRPAA